VEALGVEEVERGVADVNLEEAGEELRVALEGGEDAGTQLGVAIHEEEAAGHEGGKALDAAVGLLVGGEVVGVESVGEGGGLTEAEGQALAGDGVD
jgi:hypothetical protein